MIPAIPAKPLMIVPVSRLPNIFTACDSITRAAANINTAAAVLVLRFPNLANAKKPANSNSTAAMANKPPPRVSASILPSNFNAPAIPINATLNINKADAVCLRPLCLPSKAFIEKLRAISNPAKPTSPVSISPISMVDRIFIATESNIKDVAIVIK